MNEYLQDAKDSFAKIFSSLSEDKQKDLLHYYDVYSVEGFYREAKERASSIKYYADRRGYGQGECIYYFSKNDDENTDLFEEMGEPLAKKYLGIMEAYFDMMYEMEES